MINVLNFFILGKSHLNEKDIIDAIYIIWFRFVEINLSGYDRPYERHGNKYIVTAPGWHMRYESMERPAVIKTAVFVIVCFA